MQELEVTFSPEPSAARQARSELTRFAPQLDLERASALALVVSELVTNSVVHGPNKPITLRLSISDDGWIRGEVEDQGDGTVAIREDALDDLRGQGGLGLHLVRAETSRWGVYPGSTHVWFEMDPPGASPAKT